LRQHQLKLGLLINMLLPHLKNLPLTESNENNRIVY